MLHGWHAHNGVSLDNPRLGFVVTGQTVEGDPGLEGYYYEYDHDLKPDERLRFAPDEKAPPFDPDKQPTLSHTDWPDARLKKVERSYAMEYVRSLLPTMLDLFGPAETRLLVGRAAKLIGLQFYDEIADLLEIPSGGAAALADLIAALSAGQGESVTVSAIGTAGSTAWTARIR